MAFAPTLHEILMVLTQAPEVQHQKTPITIDEEAQDFV